MAALLKAIGAFFEMSAQPLARCDSGTTLLSHHEGAPLHAATTRDEHNNCRSCSSHTKPLSPSGFHSHALLSLLVVFLSWSSLSVVVSASETHGDRPALLLVADDQPWKGSSLLLDQRPPPIIPLLMPPLHGEDDATQTLSAPPSKRSITTDPSVDTPDFTIPKPFDTGLSNNFTSACASFLARMRNSDAFNNCHPFSLMLQVRFHVRLMIAIDTY